MTLKTPVERREEFLRTGRLSSSAEKPLTWSKLFAKLIVYSLICFIAVAVPVVSIALITAVVAFTWRIVSGM